MAVINARELTLTLVFLLLLLAADPTKSGANATCLWTNFCNRLGYSRHDELEKPRKSLLFYNCGMRQEFSSDADCLPVPKDRIQDSIRNDVILQLESVASVQVSQLRLTKIPQGLCLPSVMPRLESIDLSGNRLNSEAITSLSTRNHAGCRQLNVSVLKLSDNWIETIDLADVLSEFPRLEALYLDNAGLKYINLRAYYDLNNSTLRLLSLSRNTMVRVDINILALPSLEIVYLNRIEYANGPLSFASLRGKSAENETISHPQLVSLTHQFAQSNAIKLRRMERALQNRNFDYHLTLNFQASDLTGLFETLALGLGRHAVRDAGQIVRIVSRFIEAFDYIRFDVQHATIDCHSICASESRKRNSQSNFTGAITGYLEDSSLSDASMMERARSQRATSPVGLPSLVRFFNEHLSTLKRILSTSHFEWLLNVMSVRCASAVGASQVTLRDLVSEHEAVYQESQTRLFSTNQPKAVHNGDLNQNNPLVESFCRGLERDRVRPFAIMLRSLLDSNASDSAASVSNVRADRKVADVSATFACGCSRCAVQFEAPQRVLVIAIDCSGGGRNFTVRQSVGDSLRRLIRAVSQELGDHWRVDWPLSNASADSALAPAQRINHAEKEADASASVNANAPLQAYIDLNLAASRIDAFDNYENELAYVRNLVVANNSVQELDENLFRSMNSLQSLDVRHNQLHALPSVVILALHKLASVRLEGNLFECSCALYSQLFEAQSLQILHKIIDFNTLTCAFKQPESQSSARKTLMLTDVIRNLSIFLNDCPAVYRMQLRITKRTTEAASFRVGELAAESSNSDAIRDFLSNNVLYILLVCTFLIVVLAVLFAVCVTDYVKACRAQYFQVRSAEDKQNFESDDVLPSEQYSQGQWVESVGIRSTDSGSKLRTVSLSPTRRKEIIVNQSSSVDGLNLPQQSCTINMFLTNLINEDKHRQELDNSDEAEERRAKVLRELTLSIGESDLQNFTESPRRQVVTRDSCSDGDYTRRADRVEDAELQNFSNATTPVRERAPIKQRVAIPAELPIASESGAARSPQADRAARTPLFDQSATLQQL